MLGLVAAPAVLAHDRARAAAAPDPQRWMSALPDRLALSEITIPGTHDSATRFVTRMAQCQTLTLLEQLAQGIRFLDIRCQIAGDALKLYHGPVALDLFFESDVCDACLGFLSLNPGETIVLLVSNESGADGRRFESMIRRIIARDRARWHLDDRIPSMRQARGRIVLIRRFPVAGGTEPFGLDGTGWADDQSFQIANHAALDIQDQYIVPQVPDIVRKWAAIRALLEKSRAKAAGVWMINYCSGTSGRIPDLDHLIGRSFVRDAADPYPDQVALGADGVIGENQRLLDYIRTTRPVRPLGTILLDYAGGPGNGELLDRLIRLNFETG